MGRRHPCLTAGEPALFSSVKQGAPAGACGKKTVQAFFWYKMEGSADAGLFLRALFKSKGAGMKRLLFRQHSLLLTGLNIGLTFFDFHYPKTGPH